MLYLVGRYITYSGTRAAGDKARDKVRCLSHAYDLLLLFAKMLYLVGGYITYPGTRAAGDKARDKTPKPSVFEQINSETYRLRTLQFSGSTWGWRYTAFDARHQ